MRSFADSGCKIVTPAATGFRAALPVTGTLAEAGRASSGRRTRLDDLGVAPSTQTQQLHKQLLR